jgi:hypothetical protein
MQVAGGHKARPCGQFSWLPGRKRAARANEKSLKKELAAHALQRFQHVFYLKSLRSKRGQLL